MKWTVNKLSEAKQIQVELADSGVKILMEPKQYACVECTSEKYPCEENSVYQIISDIPTEDRKCKLIANWYQGETVIARRYINGKGETVNLTYPDGMISWLSGFTSEYDGSVAYDGGNSEAYNAEESAFNVIINYFRNLIEYFLSLFR